MAEEEGSSSASLCVCACVKERDDGDDDDISIHRVRIRPMGDTKEGLRQHFSFTEGGREIVALKSLPSCPRKLCKLSSLWIFPYVFRVSTFPPPIALSSPWKLLYLKARQFVESVAFYPKPM